MANRIALATTTLLGTWLVAASAGAQPAYMDSGVFYLKNYVTADAATCDRVTATGERYHCDLKDAFRTALQACADNRDKYGLEGRIGCIFVVPEGRHRLTETVELCRSHVVMGESGWRQTNATWIEATTTAFSMLGAEECQARNLSHTSTPPTPDRGFGGSPMIKGLQLSGPGQHPEIIPPPVFGILMKTSGKVENVTISSFVQGIRIAGNGGFAANANAFVLRDLTVKENEHAGIFVDGNDANAGLGEMIDVSNNCVRADYWKTQPAITTSSDGLLMPNTCSGLWDSSVLGNTWISVTSEEVQDYLTFNGNGALNYTYYPGTLFDPSSAFQASMCLGCYIENQKLSPMAPLSVALGLSSNHWDGTGWYMIGGAVNKLAVGNTKHPDYNLRVEMGFEENTFIKLVRTEKNGIDLPAPFRMRYAPANSSYQLDVQAPNEVEPQHSLNFIGYGSVVTPTMQGLPTGSLYVKNWLRAERVQVINKIHAADGRYTVLEMGGENEDNPSFLRMWYSTVASGATLSSAPLILEYNPDNGYYQFQVSERPSLRWQGTGSATIGFLKLEPSFLENFCSLATSCGE